MLRARCLNRFYLHQTRFCQDRIFDLWQTLNTRLGTIGPNGRCISRASSRQMREDPGAKKQTIYWGLADQHRDGSGRVHGG